MTTRLYDQLSLKTLKLLLAIGECGSLTQAANQLHIVPSAASRRMRELELAVKMPLLKREARCVELTPAGYAMARYAKQIIADAEILEGELRDLKECVQGHVRLLAAASAIAQHLPCDLARFLAKHPFIRVDLQESTSGAIAEKILHGAADVGILVAAEPWPGLDYFTYREEQLAVVLPAGHPCAGRDAIRFDRLLDEHWVGLPPGTALANLLAEQARRHGRELRTRIQVFGLDSICRMVQGGLGIAVLPVGAFNNQVHFPGLAAVALEDDWARRRLCLVVRKGERLSVASTALIATLTGEDGSEAPPLPK